MDFRSAIKEIRHKCLLTQAELAAAVGVSFSTINRWENGKTIPNIQALKRLDGFCKEKSININLSDCVWGE